MGTIVSGRTKPFRVRGEMGATRPRYAKEYKLVIERLSSVLWGSNARPEYEETQHAHRIAVMNPMKRKMKKR
jgi:hypothetical protein